MLNSFIYQKGQPLQTNVSRAQMFAALGQKDSILWVDLENPNDFESESLVEIFNFHDLAVEDCVSDISSPKVDDYGEYLFLVMHAINLDSEDHLHNVELDIFLGKNFVVTFHKEPVKGIGQVREIVQKQADIPGTDILVHMILDHLIDNYMPVIDRYDFKVDELEDEIFNHAPADCLTRLLQIKRDLYTLRRIIAPQRDTIYFLTRNPTVFIKTKNMIYFRDVYDHLFRIYGITEGYHETLTSILQAYFSYQSNKLNEIVKRMTILATLTMPSVIIASIYGMNFKFMPELEWEYGYLVSIGLMVLVGVVMLIWMKWKKWI